MIRHIIHPDPDGGPWYHRAGCAAPKLNDNRGVALILTLVVVSLLISGALALNRKARATVVMSAAIRDRSKASHMAASGIELGMAILAADKKASEIDSLQEDWADPEWLKALAAGIAFDEGTLTIRISDERARIQVNALVDFPDGKHMDERQQGVWDRFLRQMISRDDAFEQIEVPPIIDCAKDWLDSGDDDMTTGLNGAEADYYQNLDPPYSCSNGPFRRLSELLLVKGMTPALYYGIENQPGISAYMTADGVAAAQGAADLWDGKININTAELPVLAALLPSEDEDLAQSIVDYRSEMSDGAFVHDLSQNNWYQNAPGCGDVSIDAKLAATSSNLFRIQARAGLNGLQQTITAVVQREKETDTGRWTCRIRRWRQE